MNELKELVRVALSGRIRGIETFNQHKADKRSLTYKLLKGIAQSNFSSDADARLKLYGENYRGKKYNMLKERFKEKLYTNVLFLQPKKRDTSSYAHNAYYCHKHYIVAKLLIMIAAKKTGRRIMKKVLDRAVKFEVFEIAMLAALSLQKQALLEGNIKNFNAHNLLAQVYMKIAIAENEAETIYNSLVINFSRSFALKPDLINETKNCISNIENLKNAYSTYNTNYNYFLVSKFYYELTHNYNAALKECNNFEKYLLKNTNTYSTVRHGNIIIMMLECNLYLGNFIQGLKLAQNSIDLFEEKEGNWFVLQELNFLLAIRSENYNEANAVFIRVENILKSINIDERQKELWRIYGGYLWLASTIFYRKSANEIVKKSSFKIEKLMNEVIIYTKDKKAANLSIGILQLLFFIHRKDFVKAIEKVESLKAYTYKYIDRKAGARDFIFIKLIHKLVINDFNPAKTEKNTGSLLEKLKMTNIITDAYSRTRIEILPYEQMWKLILTSLSM